MYVIRFIREDPTDLRRAPLDGQDRVTSSLAEHAPVVEAGSGKHLAQTPGLNSTRKWLAAAAVAVLVLLVLPARLGWAVRVVAAWDAAAVVLLALIWQVILCADATRTRMRAAIEDPGGVALLITTLIASAVSLAAAVILMRRPEMFAPDSMVRPLVGVAIFAVAVAWSLVHTAFALHYAHLYYTPEDNPGGLDFAGGPPDDLDFAYFAFTVGMTFQVSDVVVSDRDIRHVVLLHALLAFVFNTVIVALAINLIFGRLG